MQAEPDHNHGLPEEMKAPTAAQRRTWTKLVSFGCCACHLDGNEGTPGEIHHIKDYGKRDHSRVYLLCPAHHRPTAMVPGVLSIHHNRLEFIEKYGDEDSLLKLSLELAGIAK